jgi:hypothetical protein
MPRTPDSFEARILTYFQTADLAAVELLFGLISAAVRTRRPAKGAAPKKTRGPGTQKAAPQDVPLAYEAPGPARMTLASDS